LVTRCGQLQAGPDQLSAIYRYTTSRYMKAIQWLSKRLIIAESPCLLASVLRNSPPVSVLAMFDHMGEIHTDDKRADGGAKGKIEGEE
jgi:hypothetical protein